MARVKISSCIKNKTTKEEHKVDTYAIYQDNKIQYKDGNIKVEIRKEKNQIIMIRADKEVSYEFLFQQGNSWCKCQLLKQNRKLKLSIMTDSLEINENNFKIEYQMEEGDKFEFTFFKEN